MLQKPAVVLGAGQDGPFVPCCAPWVLPVPAAAEPWGKSSLKRSSQHQTSAKIKYGYLLVGSDLFGKSCFPSCLTEDWYNVLTSLLGASIAA